MKLYRELKVGERLLPGDERISDDQREWLPIQSSIGLAINADMLASYRRPVDAVPQPHWRTVDDIRGYVGDRIVAICQWSEQHDRVVNRHVITLTIHEDGVIRDNEDLGYCLHDCDCWMPEAEFVQLLSDLDGGAP